jgi:hypothetical protein
MSDFSITGISPDGEPISETISVTNSNGTYTSVNEYQTLNVPDEMHYEDPDPILEDYVRIVQSFQISEEEIADSNYDRHVANGQVEVLRRILAAKGWIPE